MAIGVESGCQKTLDAMDKGNRVDVTRSVLKNLYETGIATQVMGMFGFPGETDREFQNTMDLIDSLPVSYLHVFPFSARPGTKAADLPDKVDVSIIKKRCERMRILGNDKRKEFFRGFIGQVLPILVETNREASTNLLKGISSNYVPVLIDAGDNLKNRIVDVKIEKHIGHHMFGTL